MPRSVMSALLCLTVSHAIAQTSIPEPVLDKLKAATVLVTVGGRGEVSGSGFLIEKRGEFGFVVTNAHVVESSTQLGTVFHSGTKNERLLRGVLVAKDSDRDLAVIRVPSEGLPEPLDLSGSVALRETLPVCILGFPFGTALSLSKGRPTVTIAQGSISSIRRDDSDRISLVQLDGDINPGNSGGPVVDANGALIGVSVAKLRGTHIGLAIPSAEVQVLLRGRAGAPAIVEKRNAGGSITVRVRSELVDPLNVIEAVSVRITHSKVGAAPVVGDAAGNFPELPDAEEHALTIDDRLALGEAELRETAGITTWRRFQVKFKRRDGTTGYSGAKDLKLEFAAASTRSPDDAGPAQTRPAAADAPAEVRPIPLKGYGYDFAYNPEAGTLLAIDLEHNSASLYAAIGAASADPIAVALVGAEPTAALFKRVDDRAYFVVACHGELTLDVLNAETLRREHRIQLGQLNPLDLAASQNPDDPYVYYRCGSSGTQFHTVDLREMRDIGPLDAQGDWLDVSADGSRILTIRQESGRMSRVDVTEKGPCLAKLGEARLPRGGITDPRGRYVASKLGLYSADLQQRISEWDLIPISFMPDRPIILARDSSRIIALSYNTFRVAGHVKLPDGLTKPDPKRKRPKLRDAPGKPDSSGDRLRIFADAKHNLAVLASNGLAFSISLDRLAPDSEPFLYADLTLPESLMIGETLDCDLQLWDDRVLLEAVSLPAGVELHETTLRWTPQASQVGLHDIAVRLRWRDTERDEHFRIRVRHPAVELGFVPETLRVAPDGRSALAYGNEQKGPNDEGICHIAIIDLDRGDVRTERTLPFMLGDACVDASGVYILPLGFKTVSTLAGDDLHVLHTTHLTDRLRHLSWAPGDRLFVYELTVGTSVFRTPELGTVSTDEIGIKDPKRATATARTLSEAAPQPILDGWLYQNCIFDAGLNSVQVLLGRPEAFLFHPLDHTPPQQALLPHRWARYLSGDFMHAPFRTQPLDKPLGTKRAVIMPDHPAMAKLVVEFYGKPERVRQRLEVCDLFTAAADGPGLVLRDADRSDYGDGRSQLASAADVVVVSIGSTLYVVYLTESQLRHFRRPIQFRPTDIPLVLKNDEPTAWAYQLDGGRAPFEFGLSTPAPGVDLDRSTGTMAVKAHEYVKKAAQRMVGQFSTQTGDPTEPLRTFRKRSNEEFKRITGRDCRGYLATLYFDVTATDRDGQIAYLTHYVFLELPHNLVEEHVKQQQAERARVLDAERARMPKPVERPSRPRKADPAGVNEKLSDLEQRVGSMRAKVDAALKLLGGLSDDEPEVP